MHRCSNGRDTSETHTSLVPMDLDLHIHSNVSDGILDPSDVVAAAVEAHLDAIAIADHDTVLGIAEAVEVARQHRIEVIPAIEVSTMLEGVELHILGYFIDPSDEGLLAHVREASTRREERLREMIGRLADQGLEISFEVVSSLSSDRGTLGRPHLARAMMTAGYVSTFGEAFDRYIGNDHPAYVPTHLLDPHQAIELIRRAGGISMWAHPPTRYLGEFLSLLTASGLCGLEVYRPKSSRKHVLELERIAKERDLLVSGGSDWHGPEQGPLGDFRVHASEVSELLAAGGI